MARVVSFLATPFVRAGLGRVGLAAGIALSVIWLTSTLTEDAFARTAVALSLIATGSIGGVFGSNRVLLRDLASVEIPSAESAAILGVALQTAFRTTLASVAVTTVAVGVIVDDWSALTLAATALATIAGAVLYLASDGFRAVSSGWLPELTFGRYGGALPVWLWIGLLVVARPTSTGSVLGLLAVISAAVAAPVLVKLVRMTGAATDGGPALRQASPFGVTQLTGLVLQSADLWVGALILETRQLAFYAAARQFLMVVALPLQAAQLAFVAPLARTAASGTPAELQRIATRAVQRAAPPAILAGLILLAVPRQLLGLVFPDGYDTAALALVILVGGQMFNALTGLCGQALSMSGHEKKVTRANLVAAISLPVLAALAAPLLGIEGLALAVVATTLGLFGSLWWMARRELGIETHLRLAVAS